MNSEYITFNIRPIKTWHSPYSE